MGRKANYRPEIQQPEDQSIRYIALTKNLIAIVASADYAWLMQWVWFATLSRKNFYASRNIKLPDGRRRQVYMHRELLNAQLPMHVDHINGNTLDNRRSNLRAATCSQNSFNRGMNANNTSGFKGVTYHPDRRKYAAQISANGKYFYLGLFQTAGDAHAVYCKASANMHGEFASKKAGPDGNQRPAP